MSVKSRKLRPKEMKFLEAYAQRGDLAEAYQTAGFRVKSREVARVSAHRLLRKIDEGRDYREIIESVGLSDRRVAEALKALLEHPDPRVRVQAVHIASRCLGWQKEQNENLPGIAIVIHSPSSSQKDTQPFHPEQAPDPPRNNIPPSNKPISLLR